MKWVIYWHGPSGDFWQRRARVPNKALTWGRLANAQIYRSKVRAEAAIRNNLMATPVKVISWEDAQVFEIMSS